MIGARWSFPTNSKKKVLNWEIQKKMKVGFLVCKLPPDPAHVAYNP